MRFFRLFGQRGRTTIPQPIRDKLGWQVGDLLAFHMKGGAVIVTREYAQAPAGKAAVAKDKFIQLVLLLIGGDGGG